MKTNWLALVLALLLQEGNAFAQGEKKSDNLVAVKPRVTFISNNTFEFWAIAKKGAEKAAKDFGLEVDFLSPATGKAEEQLDLIDEALKKGAKAIAISPSSIEGMEKRLVDLGKSTPLIVVDADLPDPASRRASLGAHNYRMGRAIGELLATRVPKGGKFAIFVGHSDRRVAVERRQGILDALAGEDGSEMTRKTPRDAKNVKVGKFLQVETIEDQCRPDDCQRFCEEFLETHPDTVALIGLWAYNPPAILRAAKNTKNKVLIFGFDEDESTLAALESGDIAATIVQQPFEFGYQAVYATAGLSRNNPGIVLVLSNKDRAGRIWIPHHVITRENVAEFRRELKCLRDGNEDSPE